MTAQVDYRQGLKLDETELQSRRAYFKITEEDLRRLASLRGFAERHGQEIVDGFYELLLGHPESRTFFPDDATVRRVKKMQLEYFLGFFSGKCDAQYVQDRLRVGAAHERIVGLSPKWYIGGYARYLRLLLDRLFADMAPDEARAAYRSVTKVIAFDMALAIDTFIAADLDTIARHQMAIRKLSTPVIRVYHRVLLLPLIGTVDSHRAEQIMGTLLVRVVEEQARAVIIDIAGVPVVDTRVADHFLKTTEAVRLLGAETILTGISAQVARTIVQLGVDISSMHTRAQLAEGIELALGLVGRAITVKAEECRTSPSPFSGSGTTCS